MFTVGKKGDFKGFDELSHEAEAFRHRLLEMGYSAESENTYILKELESKLNTADLQKWLKNTFGNAVKLHPRIFSYFGDDITVPKKAIYIGGGKIEILIGMNDTPSLTPTNINVWSTKWTHNYRNQGWTNISGKDTRWFIP